MKMCYTVYVFRFLKEWICSDLPKPVSSEELNARRKMQIRNIVARVSRGNVSLAQGKFMTSEDVEKLREENKKYDFVKGR